MHLSHGVIQATADPWLGEGRLPLHPCSPAAGDAPAPRSPGTRLLNYVLCVASFRPCPPSCLPSTPTSTGPLLPRMLTHRSPLVTCAVGLAAAWACAALGPQLLGLGRSDGSPPPPRRRHAQGGGRLHEGDPGCRRHLPGFPRRRGAARGRSGQCPPALLSPLELMFLSQASATSPRRGRRRQLCTPHPRRGSRSRWPAWGRIFLRNHCWSQGGPGEDRISYAREHLG